MKSVIKSLYPEVCERITSGKQTIIVAKSAPKEVPFKVYIYQTKKRWIYKLLPWLKERQAKVIGEFICDKVERFDSKWSEWAYAVAPIDIPCAMPMSEEKAIRLCKEQAFLTDEDIVAYFGDEDWKAAFWHISDLKIYDKPKELGEFGTVCKKDYDYNCGNCEHLRVEVWSYAPCDDCADVYCGVNNIKPLTRPPQSWQYVEEV